MGEYFPSGSITGGGSSGNPLVAVLRPLSPKGKQAMFAAANAGLIARGTWNGCAFNAASLQHGKNISDSHSAAMLFDTTESIVSRFINTWDNLKGSDEQCTQLLRDALETVGLFTDPKEGRVKRIIRGYAYKSEQTRMREEFDALMLQVDFLESGASEEVATPEAVELHKNAQKIGALLST